MMRRLALALGHVDRRVFPRPRRVACCSSPIRSPATPTRRATSRWPPANRPWRAAIRRACSATCRKLLERAGPGPEGGGSITGVFAVLVDGDDHNDPVADAMRGTLDGHIVLDRAIADQGRYPAVNVLGSISRLADIAWTPEQRELVRKLRTHDRALRGHARPPADGRLSGRQRPGARPRRRAGAAHLRRAAAEPGKPPSNDAFADLAQVLLRQ